MHKGQIRKMNYCCGLKQRNQTKPQSAFPLVRLPLRPPSKLALFISASTTSINLLRCSSSGPPACQLQPQCPPQFLHKDSSEPSTSRRRLYLPQHPTCSSDLLHPGQSLHFIFNKHCAVSPCLMFFLVCIWANGCIKLNYAPFLRPQTGASCNRWAAHKHKHNTSSSLIFQ